MTIRGDNVRFQNFEVDGDPDPDESQHYARHGVNVKGSDAVIQGNTIHRADSPDVTSAAVRVNDKNTVVRYNNMRDSQQSINFGSESSTPAVCGNQFEDGIGGVITEQSQKDVATLNHWGDGMPSNLAQTLIELEQTSSEEETMLPREVPKESLMDMNSRIDPSVLGETAGRAGLPFRGTKMGSSNAPGECELSISLTNAGLRSLVIEEIKITVDGQPTNIQVVEAEELNLGEGESADTHDGPIAVGHFGGDGTYDKGDSISVKEDSFDEIQTYTTEGTLEPLPSTGSESGGGLSPSSFSVQTSSGESVTTTSSPEPSKTIETKSDTNNDGSTDSGGDTTSYYDKESQDFGVALGDYTEVTLGDEVVFEPILIDVEGEAEHEWDFGDGTTSTDSIARHIYEESGTYTVELTVTDSATGETNTDSAKIKVKEGTRNVETIQSDEQQELADLVQEDPDGEGKILYLEEGETYTSLDTISAKDLTIIGQGEEKVTLEGPITVTSSGVTFKNVEITNGLVVQNNDFKLYNSEVSNMDGYAVELNANDGGFQIGDSKLTGQNGVYVDVDSDVLVSNNDISATGDYGVYTMDAVTNLRIRDNTIESSDTGIYESLLVEGEYEQNTITAPTEIEEQKPTAPEVNDISVEPKKTDVSVTFSTQVSDPDGYAIDEVTWGVNGETFTRIPGNDLVYTFDESGEYTISVTVTDRFGKTTTESKTVQIDAFDVSLVSPDTVYYQVGSQFDVSTSIDSQDVDEYAVDFTGDGVIDKTYNSAPFTYTFQESGEQDVTVKVTDSDGETGTDTKTVNVENVPLDPVINIETPQNKRTIGESIGFNGENSITPEGYSLTYEWDFDMDGTYEATGDNVNHQFDEVGSTEVRLRVTDDYGRTGTTTKEIEIQPPPDPFYDAKVFSQDTTLEAGTYSYKSMVVEHGVTITAKGDPSQDGPNSYGGVKFDVEGPVKVNGNINANDQGYGTCSGPGIDKQFGYCYGANYGGGGNSYGSAVEANRLGSGADDTGGGGSVWIDSEDTVTINGVITSDVTGHPNGDKAATGSGGSVRIDAETVKGTGHLSAEGGDCGEDSSAGSGGRILIKANDKSSIGTDVSGGEYMYFGMYFDAPSGTVRTIANLDG